MRSRRRTSSAHAQLRPAFSVTAQELLVGQLVHSWKSSRRRINRTGNRETVSTQRRQGVESQSTIPTGLSPSASVATVRATLAVCTGAAGVSRWPGSSQAAGVSHVAAGHKHLDPRSGARLCEPQQRPQCHTVEFIPTRRLGDRRNDAQSQRGCVRRARASVEAAWPQPHWG